MLIELGRRYGAVLLIKEHALGKVGQGHAVGLYVPLQVTRLARAAFCQLRESCRSGQTGA